MPHIVSSHTADVKYVNWINHPDGGPNVKNEIPGTGRDHVLIKGKHGVVQRNKTRGIFTVEGPVTQVTEAELEFLKHDQTFMQHLKNGAVRIIESDRKPDGEEIAKDLKLSPDRPLTDKDRLKGGRLDIPDDMKPNGGAALQ